jgi:hypothetical protein
LPDAVAAAQAAPIGMAGSAPPCTTNAVLRLQAEVAADIESHADQLVDEGVGWWSASGITSRGRSRPPPGVVPVRAPG